MSSNSSVSGALGRFRVGLVSSAVASTFLFGAAPALAADSKPTKLSTVKVEADAETDGYKANKASSPKYTEPLRDTPRTITVIPKKVLEEQNLLSMRDILSTVPGITFGAGEGGGGFGDNINIRGFASSGDITIDGIRDSAQYSRSDTFNLEQVEVTKGSSSAYNGSGSVGGNVNLVSKAARNDNFTVLSAGVGTDSYARATVDTNQTFGEDAAFRLNVMGHQNDAPGRDYENFERWGVAPSVTFGLDTPTQISLSAIHQEDDNIPQYGVPFYNGRPLPGVDPSNYYGYHNVDTQEVELDQFTLTLEHDFSDAVALRNLTRWQQTSQLTIVDPPQGTWCLPNNQTPTGAACLAGTAPNQTVVPPGMYQPSGPRGNVRDTENDLLINQTSLTWHFATGAVSHALVTGLEISEEKYDFKGSNEFRTTPGGATVATFPLMDIYHPDSLWTGPRNRVLTGKTSSEMDNTALYAFDTLSFTPQWELALGARFDANRADATPYKVTDGVPAVNTAAIVHADNDLFSWNTGLVYKPQENGSIYLSYADSETPSVATVNGTCNVSQTTNNSGQLQGNANCNTDPEEAETYEFGTKWDLLDGRLALTGALFRTERTNYKVNDPGNPDNPSGQQQLDGSSRVQGIELGIAGQLSNEWAVFANYTHQKSKVLQGASDFAAGAGMDYTKGDPLLNVPEDALSLWTTYQFTDRFQLGYGATYQGEVTLTQHSASNVNGALVESEDYWVHRASASYKVNRELTLQLNVNNLLDEEYYTRMRNNGWATPGDPRNATLTATYAF